MYKIKIIIFIISLVSFFQFSCSENNQEQDFHTIDELLLKIKTVEVGSQEFLELADSIISNSKEIDYKDGLAEGLFLKGDYYLINSDNEKALLQYKESYKVSELAKNNYYLGNSLRGIGYCQRRLNNREKALKSFKKSLPYLSIAQDSLGISKSANLIGYMYWKVSEFDSAIVYFNKSADMLKNLSDIDRYGAVLNNIGTVYYQWTIYDKALEYYLQSLALQKEVNDDNGTALILTNIGLVYKDTHQKEKAIDYFNKALEYSQIDKNPKTLGYIYHSKASTLSDEKVDTVISYYKKSYQFYNSAEYVGGKIIALRGLGESYLKMEKYDLAKGYFSEILKLGIENDIKLRIAEGHKHLGTIKKIKGNYLEAVEHFRKCIELSKILNKNDLLRDSYKSLSEIYNEQGKIEKAYYSLKEHEKYRSLIENDEMHLRLSSLKKEFELEEISRNLEAKKHEIQQQRLLLSLTVVIIIILVVFSIVLFKANKKRKKAINLLNKSNKLIQKQSEELTDKNDELVELNKSRDKFYSIIAHDLKNPFFSLIGYSSWLREDYDIIGDKERKEHINVIHKTSKKAYELLENLLNLSYARTGKLEYKPENLVLNSIVKEIIDLVESHVKRKNIRIINKINDNTICYADKYMIEVVIRNLLSNAIKFTDDYGKIEISSFIKGDEVYLSIKDNGIGISEERQKELFNINVVTSEPGTASEVGTGLGLGLCKEFINKNHGDIFVESEPDKGSEFVFYLPQSKLKEEILK